MAEGGGESHDREVVRHLGLLSVWLLPFFFRLFMLGRGGGSVYFDPFEEIRRLHTYIDRMFSDMLRSPRVTVNIREPLVDLLDEGNVFRLVVELPGMSKEDIDVRVTEDTVTIKAEKRGGREEKDKNYFIRERTYTSYYRTITLPEPVIPEETKARYNNGVLEIILKKKTPANREEQGHRVKIE